MRDGLAIVAGLSESGVPRVTGKGKLNAKTPGRKDAKGEGDSWHLDSLRLCALAFNSFSRRPAMGSQRGEANLTD